MPAAASGAASAVTRSRALAIIRPSESCRAPGARIGTYPHTARKRLARFSTVDTPPYPVPKNLPMKGGWGGRPAGRRPAGGRACAAGRCQRADGRHPAQAPAVRRSRARESSGAGRRRPPADGPTTGVRCGRVGGVHEMGRGSDPGIPGVRQDGGAGDPGGAGASAGRWALPANKAPKTQRARARRP